MKETKNGSGSGGLLHTKNLPQRMTTCSLSNPNGKNNEPKRSDILDIHGKKAKPFSLQFQTIFEGHATNLDLRPKANRLLLTGPSLGTFDAAYFSRGLKPEDDFSPQQDAPEIACVEPENPTRWASADRMSRRIGRNQETARFSSIFPAA